MVFSTHSSVERGTTRREVPRQVMSPTRREWSFTHSHVNFSFAGLYDLWAYVVTLWAHVEAYLRSYVTVPPEMSLGNQCARSVVILIVFANFLALSASHSGPSFVSKTTICVSNPSQSVSSSHSEYRSKPSEVSNSVISITSSLSQCHSRSSDTFHLSNPIVLNTALDVSSHYDLGQFSTLIPKGPFALGQSLGSSRTPPHFTCSLLRLSQICNTPIELLVDRVDRLVSSSSLKLFNPSVFKSSVSSPSTSKLNNPFLPLSIGILPSVFSCLYLHLDPVSPPSRFIMADVTFNLTAAPITDSRGGYTRATRTNLKDEALVKVKDAAVKKILSPVLSAHSQVSSFDPREMADKGNFFHQVGDWRTATVIMRQHVQSFYMMNVFILCKEGQVDDPANPGTMIPGVVVSTENLFDAWHNVTVEELAESVRLIAEHSNADVDRQNLHWSWEFILNNIDDALRHYVLSEVEAYPAHIGQSGPMALYLVANKIVTGTANLAHNVISALMVLELRHFKGEDVTECVFVLRNVLKFLNHGHPVFDRSPPTIMDTLVGVFSHATNSQFRQWLQNLQDFHPSDIDTPEKLFAQVQTYYNTLLTNPGKVWLPHKKTRASFVSETVVSQVKEEVPSKPSTIKMPEKDRGGNIIDRVAPTGDEPRTRTNEATGRDEHWCGKCPKGGRWGNHDSQGHDKWLEAFRKKQAERKKGSTGSVASSHASTKASKKETDAPVASVSVTQAGANPDIRSMLRRTYVSFTDSDDEDL